MIAHLLLATWIACSPPPLERPDPGTAEVFVMTYDMDERTPVDTGLQTEACEPQTVPLDPPDVAAGTTWEIGSVQASLYQPFAGAYGVDWMRSGCILLAPAGVRLDLADLGCEVSGVRISVDDGCPEGCTTVETYGGGDMLHSLSTTSSGLHTFVISECGGVDTVLVEAAEAVICPLELF